jgi:hypothetical protein
MPDLPQRVVLALTSQDRLGEDGGPTGYYLPEAAHPWQVFTSAGLSSKEQLDGNSLPLRC